jgi:hypothetical protein
LENLIGDPHYWTKHHEPLHLALLSIVRKEWANSPPINDLQLQFVAHYAGKHCLESVVIARLANEGGAHAVAVGLLRNAVESLSVVAMAISNYPEKVKMLERWNTEKVSPGKLREALETHVWPKVDLKGLWNQTWSDFWRSLARAVQPYAHFSPPLMRWHQRAEMKNDKFHLWINHPEGDFEQYRADRIATFQLLIFWVFAEMVCAFGAAPQFDIDNLRALSNLSKLKLSTSEVFFSGKDWEVQLLPFVFPRQ